MEDDNTGQDNKADSYEHPPAIIDPGQPKPPTPPTVTTGVGDAGNPPVHEPSGENNANPPPAPSKNRSSSPETWMTWLTAIIAVATVANVFIFYLESEDTSRQIGKLTDKAGGIVDSMNKALADNQKAINRAFDSNKAALDENSKQSKRALDASIEASRLDERAWVGNIGMEAPLLDARADKDVRRAYVRKGEDIIFGVVLKNSGKSIARKFTGFASWNYGPLNGTWVPVPGPRLTTPSKSLLQPGMTGILHTMPIVGLANGTNIGQITRREYTFYVFGRIYYTDVFDRQHWTIYCMYLEPSMESFDSCTDYNYTDEDKDEAAKRAAQIIKP